MSFSASSFDTFAVAWHSARLSSCCAGEKKSSKVDGKWNTSVVIRVGKAGSSGVAGARQPEPLVQLEVHRCSRRRCLSRHLVAPPVYFRQQKIRCDVSHVYYNQCTVTALKKSYRTLKMYCRPNYGIFVHEYITVGLYFLLSYQCYLIILQLLVQVCNAWPCSLACCTLGTK